MPQVEMPLSQTDYQIMNCSSSQLFEILRGLSEETRYYITNATHRLAEVDWITRRLEEDVRKGRSPAVQEGLLSLQIYLLLTCADTLGHIYIASGVKRRFKAFFENLPQEAKENLTENLLTWKTSFTELVDLGLGDGTTNRVVRPSLQQIVQSVQLLSFHARLEVVVDFLFQRRNYYTHESEYPQLGYHPNLSVMQRQRLNIPNTATLGEDDRLQLISRGDAIYITYYDTDDVITTIRWSIVRGLGQIVGSL